jgi:hypothetical protein
LETADGTARVTHKTEGIVMMDNGPAFALAAMIVFIMAAPAGVHGQDHTPDKATIVKTIGVWRDPSFDPTLRAFYYASVIEIPTPRWTAYEALRFGVTIPAEVPMTTQERAYTSPIWYTP